MRSKPTKAQLKATKQAKSKDYARLAVTASEVVLRTRSASVAKQGQSGEIEYVVVEFPYFVKFQEGFPPRVLIEKKPTTNVYKINAVKLLDWLHGKGYTAYSSAQLVQRTYEFERIEGSIDRMFEI